MKTLEDRRRAELSRRLEAVEILSNELASYAKAHGGRFLLFGSAQRGDIGLHSDVDIIADFPEGRHCAAVRFAETVCARLSLPPDVRASIYCSEQFLRAVEHTGRELA